LCLLRLRMRWSWTWWTHIFAHIID